MSSADQPITSANRIAWLGAALAAIAFLSSTGATQMDLGFYIRSGYETVAHGNITRDVATFTHLAQTWNNHAWLSNVLIYLLNEVGGRLAIAIASTLITVITFTVIRRSMAHDTRSAVPVMLLAGLVCIPFYSPRPQIATALFCAVTILLMGHAMGGRTRSPWLMVPIMALWGNLHGGYVAGLLIMLATISGELLDVRLAGDGVPERHIATAKRLCAIWVASFLALSVNPNGIANTYLVPFRTFGAAMSHRIAEWMPPDILQPRFLPFTIMMFSTGFLLIGSARRGHRLRGHEVASYLLFSAMAFWSARHIFLFAVVVAPIMARHADLNLDRVPESVQRSAVAARMRCGRLAVVAPMIIAGFFLVSTGSRLVRMNRPEAIMAKEARTIPVAAIGFLASEPGSGRVFNEYDWGSHLMWKSPAHPIFIDGRVDLNDGTINEWNLIISAREGCDRALDRWGVTYVLVKPNRPIVAHLSGRGWMTAFRGPDAILLKRAHG
jgi:hypothetical protein